MTIQLVVTDDNLNPLIEIPSWIQLTATPQFNAAGTATVSLAATPDIVEALLTERSRIDVIDDGRYFMGGPVEQDTVDWSADQDGNSRGVITVNFSDDLARIVDEVAYPDPAHASTAQVDAFYAPGAINAETLMYDLVNLNVGPGGIAARRIAKLVMASPASIGSTVTISTRFEPFGDLLRRVAIAGGGLGFRTEVVGRTRRLTVYDPTNLTTAIRFTRPLNNLRVAHLEISKPTCNVAIVGGDGTGLTRPIVERTNPASIARWGRVVQFVSAADTSDTTEMQQAGDQALADGGERGQVSFTATETDGQRYGVDYVLGNIATCEPYEGLPIAGVIRAVTLTHSPKEGKVISPLIGTDAAITDSRTLNVIRKIETRLGLPERS